MKSAQLSAFRPGLALAAIFGVAAVLAFNLVVPSLLNFYWWSPDFARWDRYIAYILRLHRELVGPFTRRPVTITLVDACNLLLGSAWLSFVAVQALLLSGSAYLVGLLSGMERGRHAGAATIFVFFASFTVLFSFVTPNDSFDEPAQYLFLLLSIYALRSRRAWLFSGSFFLGCLSRETSLFLLPGLWLLDPARPALRWRKFLIPVLAYVAFHLTRESAGDPNRFLYWARNLASLRAAGESLISYAIALSLPVGILSASKGIEPEWKRAFTITALINTPVVLFAAYAKESRLFALPLLFLWPLAGAALVELASELRAGRRRLSFLPSLLALAASALLWVSYQPDYRHLLGYRLYASALPWLLGLPWIWPRRHRVEDGAVAASQVKIRADA